jgi:hypothetical protein
VLFLALFVQFFGLEVDIVIRFFIGERLELQGEVNRRIGENCNGGQRNGQGVRARC